MYAECRKTNPIGAIEKSIRDLFMVSIGLGAPAATATKSTRKMHEPLNLFMSKIQKAPAKDIDSFLDSVSTMVAFESVTPQEIEIFRDRIGQIGSIGNALNIIERNYERLDKNKQFLLMKDALETMAVKLDIIHLNMGKELLNPEKGNDFHYLLTSQAIFFRSASIYKQILAEMKDEDSMSEEGAVSLFKATYSILRVEAFRRGKISFADLQNTYTDILTVSAVGLRQLRFKEPGWSEN